MKLLGKTNRLGGTACNPVQDGSGSPTGRTQTPVRGSPSLDAPKPSESALCVSVRQHRRWRA